jgi:hypothetical protein
MRGASAVLLAFAVAAAPVCGAESDAAPADGDSASGAWGKVGRGALIAGLAVVTEGLVLFNCALAAGSPDAYAGLTVLLSPLVFGDGIHSPADAVGLAGFSGITLYNAALKEHDVTWDQVFETNAIAWNGVIAASLVAGAVTGRNGERTSGSSPPERAGERRSPGRLLLSAGVLRAGASGHVPLETGTGGAIALGSRSGPWAFRLSFQDTGHDLTAGRTVALADSLVSPADWSVRSAGVEVRRFALTGGRIEPYACAGAAYSWTSSGSDRRLEGWRLSAGLGSEIRLASFLSLDLQGAAGRQFMDKGTVGGDSFELPVYESEDVLQGAAGLVFYR